MNTAMDSATDPQATDTAAADTDRQIPAHSKYVIVGAGIHGLSTGWHLARELRRRGLGGGEDILILDKTGVGAGASGIACGVIRNNYFQPAMRELMAHSVSVWESDPEAFAFHPVGYMQIAPEAMHENVAKIYAEQQAIGHERNGGYANNIRSLRGLAAKAEAEGVRVATGVRVTGLAVNGGAVTAVQTDQGEVGCDQ